MYLQADQLPGGTVLQDFDICIVGAGAAGIAMAKRLIGSSKKVLLLSSGSPSDKGRPEEKRQAMYKGTVGSFLQKVDPGFLDRSRLHMYGGTTNHFGFWSRPLDEVDFQSRPGYRKAAWPLGLDELAPYYQDALHFGHFGPFNFDDTQFWEDVLYARCFPSEAGDTLQGATIRAQYTEDLHDFQIQFGEELKQAPNVTVLFNATLHHIVSTENKNHITELQCATIQNGKPAQRFLSSTEAIVNINWEQIPNEESRITLNPNVLDPVFGQPASHLEWQLLDEDKRTMVRALELARDYLSKHGAVDFEYITDITGNSSHWSFPPDEGALATGDHHMGTLRMSVNPEDGIVNADSRFHTVDNLYAAGCAVFPTGGFANPTLTIVALALRLVDHLKG